jgi:hypothetical protein
VNGNGNDHYHEITAMDHVEGGIRYSHEEEDVAVDEEISPYDDGPTSHYVLDYTRIS